jgi:hypothetical protein
MNTQQYKDEIYLALIKLLTQHYATVVDGVITKSIKSQSEINRDADRMVTCMKLDRLNGEELQLVLDWWKNPSSTNVIITDPFKFRIVNDFIKKYPNVITENDPCDTNDYSKEAAMQKAKESMGNGKQSQYYTQVEYGLPRPPIDTSITDGEMDYGTQKKKIPYIPIAIGLVVILGAIGAIIYIKKSK